MSEQLELLEEVGARLDAAGFVWMLSGSVALNFYALPRMTRDIDLVIDLALADLARFLALFPPERWYRDEATIREAVRGRDMFNLIELPRAMKLDFMVRKDTEYRRTELARRRRVPLGAGAVWVAAPEDLALSKLAWARESRSPQQLADVRGLLAVAPLDREYLRRWAPELGVAELLREVSA